MTSLRTLLGIEHPILQAPMAGAQGSRLAVAVSEAGGLGALPCAMLDGDAIVREVAAIRAGTRRPFNLNFVCHSTPDVDEACESAWRAKLAPYYRDLGVDPARTRPVVNRAPFDAATADRVEPLRPPVVSFHFGLPPEPLLSRVRSWGAVLLASATTVEEARWLEGKGVDAILVQGVEAGGHRGTFLTRDLTTQRPTFALLEEVRAAVALPLIATGGLATAGDVARAKALGADGVQIGTAFLFTPEAETSAVHRAALLDAARRETTLTNVFTGRPARGFVNRLVRDLGAIAPLRAAAEALGSDDFSPLWSGTGAPRCRAMPAAELVRELAAGWAAVELR